MAREVTTHLMFAGAAEEAMTFYVSLCGDSAITQIERREVGRVQREHGAKTLAQRRVVEPPRSDPRRFEPVAEH